mmetsp:Transcript_48188/g.73364  ORF Transcript_48188/g.73364 Transcript_48188/m.73364 type:complete len:99 (+) Transcript_48188:300-596(+)
MWHAVASVRFCYAICTSGWTGKTRKKQPDPLARPRPGPPRARAAQTSPPASPASSGVFQPRASTWSSKLLAAGFPLHAAVCPANSSANGEPAKYLGGG